MDTSVLSRRQTQPEPVQAPWYSQTMPIPVWVTGALIAIGVVLLLYFLNRFRRVCWSRSINRQQRMVEHEDHKSLCDWIAQILHPAASELDTSNMDDMDLEAGAAHDIAGYRGMDYTDRLPNRHSQPSPRPSMTGHASSDGYRGYHTKQTSLRLPPRAELTQRSRKLDKNLSFSSCSTTDSSQRAPYDSISYGPTPILKRKRDILRRMLRWTRAKFGKHAIADEETIGSIYTDTDSESSIQRVLEWERVSQLAVQQGLDVADASLRRVAEENAERERAERETSRQETDKRSTSRLTTTKLAFGDIPILSVSAGVSTVDQRLPKLRVVNQTSTSLPSPPQVSSIIPPSNAYIPPGCSSQPFEDIRDSMLLPSPPPATPPTSTWVENAPPLQIPTWSSMHDRMARSAAKDFTQGPQVWHRRKNAVSQIVLAVVQRFSSITTDSSDSYHTCVSPSAVQEINMERECALAKLEGVAMRSLDEFKRVPPRLDLADLSKEGSIEDGEMEGKLPPKTYESPTWRVPNKTMEDEMNEAFVGFDGQGEVVFQ